MLFLVYFTRTMYIFFYFSLSLSLQRTYSFSLKRLGNRATALQSERSPREVYIDRARKIVFLAPIIGFQQIFAPSAGFAADIPTDSYVDKTFGFKVKLLPGWVTLPRSSPTPTIAKYQPELVILTANNFAEGASFSVTRSDARRLLKDFNVEWWFAPLEKIQDLGSPELLAELLLLQRQGNFEKRDTPSELLSAKFVDGEQALLFEYVTPLAEEVNRKTLVKAYFQREQMLVMWISALTSVYDGDYGSQLYNLRDTFSVLE